MEKEYAVLDLALAKVFDDGVAEHLREERDEFALEEGLFELGTMDKVREQFAYGTCLMYLMFCQLSQAYAFLFVEGCSHREVVDFVEALELDAILL